MGYKYGQWSGRAYALLQSRHCKKRTKSLLRPYRFNKTNKKENPKVNTEKVQAFLIALSDWQLGKEDGDGVEGVTKRVLEGIEQTKARVKALRKQGVTLINVLSHV